MNISSKYASRIVPTTIPANEPSGFDTRRRQGDDMGSDRRRDERLADVNARSHVRLMELEEIAIGAAHRLRGRGPRIQPHDSVFIDECNGVKVLCRCRAVEQHALPQRRLISTISG